MVDALISGITGQNCGYTVHPEKINLIKEHLLVCFFCF